MKKNKSGKASKLKFEDYTVEDAEKEEGELSSGQYGKIRSGLNVLRILPAREGEKWKLVFYKHFVDVPGVGTVGFVCPFYQTKGKRKCKTCDRVKKLQDGTKVDQAKADRIRAQRKVKFNAIDRKDEDAGPKEYEVGTGIDRALIEIRKVDGVNFQHPIKGCDIKILKTGEGRKGTRYKTTAARETTPLHEDEKVMQEWIENQPELKVRLEDDEDIEARLRGEDPRDRDDRRSSKRKSRDEDEDDEEMDDDDLDDQDEDDEDDEDDRRSKKKKKRRDEDEDEDEELELD